MVRIDKWLWAARFYKTRSLARQMVQSGKVSVDGQKCKPAKMVNVGQLIKAPRGHDLFEVEVLGLSENRLSAPLAQELYRETPASIERREKEAELRKMNALYNPHPDHKPDKKERRQLLKFKQQ
ncbi:MULTISPECIES: RNA-binding S4 domain-containing protein [Idiomarinaceae]|uniref:Heat shock protein 15 n=4 Tax=Pseudidiomarina TaxID=2800384 RepID=A0A368UM98_9GAMM|nr:MULTISPECIES: S4 domain-containing protein [Idiomarinaceae]MDT7526163.1 S4 domain-containing protein [Pseudidiomarina sp. GXY010]MDX1525639.1 S4 domain-containing protein [Pseudidiomarina maritima]MRJ42565.1 heat-shock protein [Idiomarina sp. FeN1]NCU58178.1 heat-shock protein [Idiomarina sp. FenA--70]NCU60876.1 heat-shock protein [Idiomarina sp. FenBw--71]